MSKLSGAEPAHQIAQNMQPTDLEARFDKVLQELRVEGLQAPLPALQEDLPLDPTDEDAYSSKVLSRRLPGKDHTSGGVSSFNYSDRMSSNGAYGGKYIDDGDDMVTVNDSISDVDGHESGVDAGFLTYGSGDMNGFGGVKVSPSSPPVVTHSSQHPSSLGMPSGAVHDDLPGTQGDAHQQVEPPPHAPPSTDHSLALMEARARRNARLHGEGAEPVTSFPPRPPSDGSMSEEEDTPAPMTRTQGSGSFQGISSASAQRRPQSAFASSNGFRRLDKMPVCERLYEMALQKREEKRKEQEKAAAREEEEVRRMRAAASAKKKSANRSNSPFDVSAAGANYFEYLYSEAEMRQQRRKQLEVLESSEARAARECTFRPAINTSGLETRTVNREMGSLYTRWKVMKAAQEEKAQKARQMAMDAESAELTFHPNTNSKYKPRHDFGSFWSRHDQRFLSPNRGDHSSLPARHAEAAEHDRSYHAKSPGSVPYGRKGEDNRLGGGRRSSFLPGYGLGHSAQRVNLGGGSDLDILEQLRFLREDAGELSPDPPHGQSESPRADSWLHARQASEASAGESFPWDLPGTDVGVHRATWVQPAVAVQSAPQSMPFHANSTQGVQRASREAPAAMQGASRVVATDVSSSGRQLSFSGVVPSPPLEASIHATRATVREQASLAMAAQQRPSHAPGSRAGVAAQGGAPPASASSNDKGGGIHALHGDRAARDAWREEMAAERVARAKAQAESHGISPQSLHYAKQRLDKHLKELFRELDTDRDGLLAQGQVVTALRRLCVFHPVASGGGQDAGGQGALDTPQGSRGRGRRNLQQEAEEGRMIARMWSLLVDVGGDAHDSRPQPQQQAVRGDEVSHQGAGGMTEAAFVSLLLEVLGTSIHKAPAHDASGSSKTRDASWAVGARPDPPSFALPAGASSTLALSMFSTFGTLAFEKSSPARASAATLSWPSAGKPSPDGGGQDTNQYMELVRDLGRSARKNFAFAGVRKPKPSMTNLAERLFSAGDQATLAWPDSPPSQPGRAEGTASDADNTEHDNVFLSLGASARAREGYADGNLEAGRTGTAASAATYGTQATPSTTQSPYLHVGDTASGSHVAFSARSDTSGRGAHSGATTNGYSGLLSPDARRRQGDVSHVEQSSREWGQRAQDKMERLRRQLAEEEMKECSFHPDVHPVVPLYLKLQKKALHLVKQSRRNARRRRHRRNPAGHRHAAHHASDGEGGASASDAEVAEGAAAKLRARSKSQSPGRGAEGSAAAHARSPRAGHRTHDGDASSDSDEAECTFKPHIRTVPESSKASFAHAKAPLFDQTVTRMRAAYEARVALEAELTARVHVPLSQRRRYLRVGPNKGADASGKATGVHGKRGKAQGKKHLPAEEQHTGGEETGGEGTGREGSGGKRGTRDGNHAAAAPGARPPAVASAPASVHRKPVLYIDVLLSRGRKGRIGVCEGDTPEELARNFAKIYSLSEVVRSHLTDLIQRHMEENRLTFGSAGPGPHAEEPHRSANSSPLLRERDAAASPLAAAEATTPDGDKGFSVPGNAHWRVPTSDSTSGAPGVQGSDVGVLGGGEPRGVLPRALEDAPQEMASTTKSTPAVAKKADSSEVPGMRQSVGLLQSLRHVSTPASTPFRKATPPRGGTSSAKKMPFATMPLSRDAELAAEQAAAAATAAVSLHQLTEGASLEKKEGGRSPKPLWQPRQPISG